MSNICWRLGRLRISVFWAVTQARMHSCYSKIAALTCTAPLQVSCKGCLIVSALYCYLDNLNRGLAETDEDSDSEDSHDSADEDKVCLFQFYCRKSLHGETAVLRLSIEGITGLMLSKN